MLCLSLCGIHSLFIRFEIFGPLVTAASHTDITANPNTATLLCNDPTQGGTGSQTRELLRAIHSERNGLHFETEVEGRLRCGRFGGKRLDRIRHWGISIGILGVLDILIQVEAQPIPTLMTHRQVGKDEVTSLGRTIQIGDTGHRHTR